MRMEPAERPAKWNTFQQRWFPAESEWVLYIIAWQGKAVSTSSNRKVQFQIHCTRGNMCKFSRLHGISRVAITVYKGLETDTVS